MHPKNTYFTLHSYRDYICCCLWYWEWNPGRPHTFWACALSNLCSPLRDLNNNKIAAAVQFKIQVPYKVACIFSIMIFTFSALNQSLSPLIAHSIQEDESQIREKCEGISDHRCSTYCLTYFPHEIGGTLKSHSSPRSTSRSVLLVPPTPRQPMLPLLCLSLQCLY
jgi:hypothetical protein